VAVEVWLKLPRCGGPEHECPVFQRSHFRSPDEWIVVTLEQIMPYQWDTEFGLKKTIYEAVRK
jgi:hypothetical protein